MKIHEAVPRSAFAKRGPIAVVLVVACGGRESTSTRRAEPAPTGQTTPADAGVAHDAFVFASLTGTGRVDATFDDPSHNDKAIVRRHVHEHLGEIRACVEQAHTVNPAFEGRITIEFTIDQKGHVIRASASGGDTSLGACLVATFKQFEFPKPDGGVVEVTYPINVRAK